MKPKLDLKLLEQLLPASPVLTGRWFVYRCGACQSVTRIDQRVCELPGVPLLQRARLAELRCRVCGSPDLHLKGLLVS